MFKEIKADNIDTIFPLLDRLAKSIRERPPPPNYNEVVKKAVEEGKTQVFGEFNTDGTLIGIILFGIVSKRISFAFADDDFKIESRMVDAMFDKYSKIYSNIITEGPWIAEEMSLHFINLGFRKLERAYMTLEREAVLSLDNPVIDSELEFNLYSESIRDNVAEVIFKGNMNHIDLIVFPEFFDSLENCQKLLENIESNVYGEYRTPYSWVVQKNGKVIGACLMTIRNDGNVGYIPDIAIDPDYQRQGVGKALLIHSMMKILEGESEIKSIDLDVTLENTALHLYESLGFKSVREYARYRWIR